jgi:CelD/BcsL family acetyltransferase involved in cellulose biosynthesis
MEPLTVQRIGSEPGLEALGPEWRELEESSGNTLPFRTFEWIRCWWRRMRESRWSLTDSLAIRVLRSADGRLVAVAPLALTERPGVGPFRSRALHFIGTDPNMTEVRGMLCEPAYQGECYGALYDALVRSADEFDWMEWTGIEERPGGSRALDDPALSWSDGVSCYVLDLPQSWEELRASRPRNLKESLRKGYNSLRRDHLAFELEVVTERPAAALDDFFHLHAARASLSGEPHHQDVFAFPACRAFLWDVCEQFASRGALRIFRLRVGGKLVATRVGFALGGCLYLYYSGYDPAYRKYGVMTTAVAEAIKVAIREGLTTVNLSTGLDVSKTRWRPREVVFREALLSSRGLLGRAKRAALGLAEHVVHQPLARRYAERLLLSRRA